MTDPLPPAELGLRQQLRAYTLAGDWAQWHECRLLLADYLDGAGRYEEGAMTRAKWEKVYHAWTMKSSSQWSFTVAIPLVLEFVGLRNRMRGKTNAGWILCFEPRSTHIVRVEHMYLRVSWVTNRVCSHWFKTDAAVHPLGLACLWREVPQGRLFEEDG